MKSLTCSLAISAILIICAGLVIINVENAEALTYTTIWIDGAIEFDPPGPGGNSWEQDEQMENVGSTYFYLTWDSTKIYVAFSATDTGLGDVCVAFDTDPGNGTTDPMWGAQFDSSVAPEYFVGVANSGYMEYRYGDTSGWQGAQDVTSHGDWGFFAGWSGDTDNEIMIPRDWLGPLGSSGLRVMAWTVDNAHANVWTAFPIAGSGGPSPGAAPVTFGVGYTYPGTGSGIAPNSGWSPTLVDLLSFTAREIDGTVLVEWETASEIDTEGFNLWRSEAEEGEYEKITMELIPSEGSVIHGASYEHTDLDIVSGLTYWYKLEDIDIYGVSTFHGPVDVAPLALCGVVPGPAGLGWALWLAVLAVPLAFIGAVRKRAR